MYLFDEDEGFDIRRDPDGEWEGINGYDEEDTNPNSNDYEVNEDGDCILDDDDEYDWTRDPGMR